MQIANETLFGWILDTFPDIRLKIIKGDQALISISTILKFSAYSSIFEKGTSLWFLVYDQYYAILLAEFFNYVYLSLGLGTLLNVD